MMTKARVKLPENLDRLTTDELVELIEQAHLGREDKLIAIAYLIDHVPMVDIGAKLNLTRSGVSRRMRGIIAKLLKMEKELSGRH